MSWAATDQTCNKNSERTDKICYYSPPPHLLTVGMVGSPSPLPDLIETIVVLVKRERASSNGKVSWAASDQT